MKFDLASGASGATRDRLARIDVLVLDDPTVADAILDRIALKGASLRKPEGQTDEEPQ